MELPRPRPIKERALLRPGQVHAYSNPLAVYTFHTNACSWARTALLFAAAHNVLSFQDYIPPGIPPYLLTPEVLEEYLAAWWVSNAELKADFQRQMHEEEIPPWAVVAQRRVNTKTFVADAFEPALERLLRRGVELLEMGVEDDLELWGLRMGLRMREGEVVVVMR